MATRVPVTFPIVYFIVLFYLFIKIWGQFYFELSLLTLGVVKSYSNSAKNACPGGAMTCNLDNNRETSILYVPNLFHYRCLQSHAASGNYFPSVWYSWPNYSLRFAWLLLLCPEMGATQPTSEVMQTFCVDTSPLILCLRLVPPTLFAVFVWCYFSRKRQTPLWSGCALLLRAIHACCGVHRVKSNKGRPLFTSGTNHPDGTSINPPPCQQWLECTYLWPWTIQMCQRQIEWGCTGAIFSLARWPFACSRLLSSPHLLLTMCQLLGKCLNFWAFSCLPCYRRLFSPFQPTSSRNPSYILLLFSPPWRFKMKSISLSHS